MAKSRTARATPDFASLHPGYHRATETTMRNRIAAMILASFGATFLAAPESVAAEKFQKLSGAQIRAKLSGMEVTDQVHWGDVYGRDGTLTSYSMGRKTVGKWRIEKDELCSDRGKDSSGCYQVWISGNKVELRRPGSDLPLEGILSKPTKRN